MSTIVGTNIEVTNLKYDSDTTSMIISNAGQVSITSEGGGNTTNLQQGLAKTWFKTSNTPALLDSFNVTQITDVSAGQMQVTMSAAFANTTYSSQGTSSHDSNHNIVANWNQTLTTTLTRYGCLKVSSQQYEDTAYNGEINGDLA
tara:strand:+ start:696 stop:1130 length:435 start_codon:yes stop_codon:yes gene_type:complete